MTPGATAPEQQEQDMTDPTLATEAPAKPAYEGWAIVELMGHRQTAGRIAEVDMAGSRLLRIDTPGTDGETVASQFYGGAAIYCITPCDEATARRAIDHAYNLPPAVRLALKQKADETPALPAPNDDDDDDDAIDF